MSKAANISQLQNLPLPEPISYFPQTWGWLALLLMLVAAAVFYGGRAVWRWQRNRYRRAALAEFAQLQAALTNSTARSALRQLPDLLKRTALAMPDHPQVASLHAAGWQNFLQQRSSGALPEDFSQQLALLAYAPDEQLEALPADQVEHLLSICQQWLEQHHVAV